MEPHHQLTIDQQSSILFSLQHSTSQAYSGGNLLKLNISFVIRICYLCSFLVSATRAVGHVDKTKAFYV